MRREWPGMKDRHTRVFRRNQHHRLSSTYTRGRVNRLEEAYDVTPLKNIPPLTVPEGTQSPSL